MTKQDKVNIFLVDDNGINLMVLERILEDLDERLICADSGEQALLEISKNEIAVILLDVQMPGMNGFEVASCIRSGERNQATPIIFLTVLEGSMDSVLKGYSAGAVDYMIKPCEPEIIKSKVKVFVDLFRMKEKIARQSELEKERDGGFWQFAVADNGVGIEPEYHKQLFKMFRRLHGPGKSRGSGIGLASCELIVHRQGGVITVDSKPGKGSVFYFTIPAEVP